MPEVTDITIEPAYVTPADVRTYTNNTAISGMDDEELTARIVAAETYIDSYAGYWDRFVIGQDHVFPRDIDIDASGETVIPTAVKFSVIAQVEFMYINMPDADHGVEQDESPTIESISPRVKQLMKGYICRIGSVTLPWVSNVLHVPLELSNI